MPDSFYNQDDRTGEEVTERPLSTSSPLEAPESLLESEARGVRLSSGERRALLEEIGRIGLALGREMAGRSAFAPQEEALPISPSDLPEERPDSASPLE